MPGQPTTFLTTSWLMMKKTILTIGTTKKIPAVEDFQQQVEYCLPFSGKWLVFKR